MLKGKNILKRFSKADIATFIVLLFHVSGCIGIFTVHKNWFVENTPLNLLIVFALIIFTQKQKNIAFFIFAALCFITGMVTEMIGVNTGLLFGNYSYGWVLGPKINNVPWLIGLNWFVVLYCAGTITSIFHHRVQASYTSLGRSVPLKLLFISFIVDAALLTTFYDWVMEPVAVKLNFWQWGGNGEIPFLNYACWFVISGVLLAVFRLLRFHTQNHFAVHLFIIQLLFFGVLRTFL